MSPFLWLALLVGANAALFLLPLFPALAEWYRRGQSPLHIPVDDEAGISYFADRFRERLAADWGDARLFASPDAVPAAESPAIEASLRAIAAGLPQARHRQYRIAQVGEEVHGATDLRTPEQPTLVGDVVRLAQGTHQIGEIYARMRLHAVGGNVLRAALCDGVIELGHGCGVLRWAHGRSIAIGSGSRAMGRVSAVDTIVIGADCRFERLSAPVLRFGRGAAAQPAATEPVARRMLVPADFPEARIEHQPGSRRWLCDDDLDIPDDSEIDGSLVVRGRLRVGARCRVRGSLKAHGALTLAEDCRIDGAAFAIGAIGIAERCMLTGPLSSGRHIAIADDCILGRKERITSVVAPTISVGHSTCYGLVWARRNGWTQA